MMSRSQKDVSACDDAISPNGTCANQDCSEDSDYLVHDIAQHTNLRSGPHKLLSRSVAGKRKLPVSTVKMLVGREGNYTGRGRFSSADGCHVLSRYLPVNGPWWVDHLKSRAYVSQFSADGSLFVARFQRSHIKVYNVDGGWKVQKNIMAKSLRWTITDTCLSPDQRFLVYSSLSPIVNIVNVGSTASVSIANITEIHEGLDFSFDDSNDDEYEGIGIFSMKFSTDGKELVAASNDNSIYVYDLEAKRPSLRILAHKADVNTVCFADETGHLLFSGSDDHLCKVWDRRSISARGKADGVLIGHLEGITFIDSRGDGRYFISNGKDQTTKLWDIRKMSSNVPYTPRLRDPHFDYRWMDYPTHARALKHHHDHTGQKYIYSGSSDGSVYIYDLVSGAQVASCHHHEAPVRDCSWHPFYPMMITSSWDGVIARWEFPSSDEEPARHAPRQRRPSY
ncbi:LEC14B-like protein [Hibiscus syriacus]|uniref:LEC14B-like protein n=1 Tax=Hibiscus syriacus TaxID=106335 RepID=A0A6A3D9L5_HIBSY|nr:LEC14B-like protein [Hibiscus syriacus]